MFDQPIEIPSSSSPRVQHNTAPPQSNARPLSRPSVDSWYIRTPARSNNNQDVLPQVNHTSSSRNHPQTGTSMNQPQQPAGRTSRDDTPVNNDSRSSGRRSPNASQWRSPPIYASAHHTTPQHVSTSTSNGNEHLFRQNPQVVVQAGPGHQGVGHQQAQSTGLGLANVPLSPYHAWTKEATKQNGYSLLASPMSHFPSPVPQHPSPAQQHTPYYAPTCNNPPYMTPYSHRQHQTILTDVPQSCIGSDCLNVPQNWSRSPHMPYDPYKPQMYGCSSASPRVTQSIPNGHDQNASPNVASRPQHYAPHMNGEQRPSVLLYSTPPLPPPNRPDNLRKRAAESPPTTDSRSHSLLRNGYVDHFGLTSVASHIERDIAANASSQSEFPVPSHAERETATGGSSQSKLPVDQSQQERQKSRGEERAAEIDESEQQEELAWKEFWERQEANNRVVDARIEDCKRGGPTSCAAQMKELCYHCINRQTSMRQ